MGLFGGSEKKKLKSSRKGAYSQLLLLVRSRNLDQKSAHQAWLFLGQLEKQHRNNLPELTEAYKYFHSRLSGTVNLSDWESLNPGPLQLNFEDFGNFYLSVQRGQINYSESLQAYRQRGASQAERPKIRGRKPAVRMVGQALEQFGLLFECGVSATEAMNTLAEQAESPYLSKALRQVGDDLAKGWKLSASMKTFPEVFPGPVVALVRSGETTGSLSGGLRRGADLLERQSRVRHKIAQAVSSPLIILGFGAFLGFGIVKFIVPKFLEVYESLKVELPALSKFVIGTISVLNEPWFIVLLILTVGLITYFRKPLKQWTFRIGLGLPMIGNWLRVVVAKETCDILADLCGCGVPLQRAFQILAECTEFEVHRSQMKRAEQYLLESGSLADSLAQVSTLPRIVSEMARIGEESGSVESLMRSLSDILTEQLESCIDQFLSTIEPLALTGLGITVGVSFVGLFLPIYGVLGEF